MTQKTWARLSGNVVTEMLTLDAALVPGKHIPALWTDDVTAVAGISVGWVKASSGTFAAPAWDGVAAKLLQSTAIEAACALAITGGFSSAALGAAHWYGSKMTDQSNLDADMMAAASGGSATTADIACSADAGTTWSRVNHTAAQIGTVWGDFRAWRIACQEKKDGLQAEIAAALTAADLTGVNWS